jgi:ADP-ribosylglycohydrolase
LPLHEQSRSERLNRAYQSLEGVCCGDAFGERFFMSEEAALSLIALNSLPAPPWTFTDDTMMAISIVATLQEHGLIDQNYLARSFAKHYDPSRGYGPAMHTMLHRVKQGEDWQKEAQSLFDGRGSFGNGAAMRVSPLGAYFADDLKLVVEQAKLSALTTHCHPEAVAGAVAVALGAALAWQLRDGQTHDEFLIEIRQRTPESFVRGDIDKAIKLPKSTPVREAARILGNGSRVTAPDTVPFALWCAATHLSDYEEALWATVSGLGDRDTTCAIVGGIVVMSKGTGNIPKLWVDCREPIPQHMLRRRQP